MKLNKPGLFRRLLAGLLSMVLLWTDVASSAAAAQQADNLWTERRQALNKGAPPLASLPAPVPLGQVTRSLDVQAPRLSARERGVPEWMADWPLSTVTVDEVRSPGGRPAVVLVKDVHGQDQAQRNISSFLTGLAWNGRRVLVGVEGASGPLDFRPFRALGPKRLIDQIADAYLSWGWIQAPEHAGLTGAAGLRFVGVEDAPLYEGNVSAYLKADAARPAALADLERLSAALEAVKARVFSPAQGRMDAAGKRYRAGGADTGAFLQNLEAEAPAVLAEGRFPQTALFLRALSLEKSLDFAAAQKERGEFLRRLTETLPPEDLRALTTEALLYRTGDRGAASFHGKLLSLGRRAGLKESSFPALISYVRYAAVADGIGRAELLAEIERVEDAAWAALRPTPAQEELRRVSADAVLTEKLARQGLSDEEWLRWGRRRPGLLKLSERARAAGAADAPAVDPTPFEAFYRCALARNEELLGRLLAARKGGDETAVLVAGGFHAAGVTESLRRRGLAYAVLSPRFDKIEAGKNALELFTRGPTPLDKLFMGERIFMANRVTVGPQAAPRAGFRFSATLSFPFLTAGARAASSEDPDAEIAEVAAAAKAWPVFSPVQGLAPAGKVRRERGDTVVPLSARLGSRPVQVDVRYGDGKNGKDLLTPAGADNMRISLEDGAEPVAATFQAAPTPQDKAGVLARWFIPGLEAAAAIAVAAAVANPWTGLAAAAAVRAGVASHALFNETGHVLRAKSRGYSDVALHRTEAEKLSPAQAVSAFLPFLPLPWTTLETVVKGERKKDTPAIRQGGAKLGFAFSGAALLLTAALSFHGAPEGKALFLAYLGGSLISLAGAFLSDLTRWTEYAGMVGRHACGNVTLIGHAVLAFSRSMVVLAQSMLEATNYGSLSAGGSAVLSKPHRTNGRLSAKKEVPFSVRFRQLGTRRGDLSQDVPNELSGLVGLTTRAYQGVMNIIFHKRLPTRGENVLNSAHPLEFNEYGHEVGDRKVGVIRPANDNDPGAGDSFSEESRPIQNVVTHNGDLDALRLHFRGVYRGKQVEYGQVASLEHPYTLFYLEHVLGSPLKNPDKKKQELKVGAQGVGMPGVDSFGVAGAMELYTTRMLWPESLRLAYQDTVARAWDLKGLPVCPQLPVDEAEAKKVLAKWHNDVRLYMRRNVDAPAPAVLAKWGEIASQIFAETISRRGASREAIAQRLAGALRGVSGIPEDRLEDFVQAALDAYLDNDMWKAIQIFDARAEGTFGTPWQSTSEPAVQVARAANQKLFFGLRKRTVDGVDHWLGSIVTAPGALEVPDPDGDGTQLAWDYAMPLHDSDGGELIRLDFSEGPGHAPQVTLLSMWDKDEDGRPREQSLDDLFESGRLRPVDLSGKWRDEGIGKVKGFLDVANRDEAAIPRVIHAVAESMQPPRRGKAPHPNRATAEKMTQAFFDRKNPRIYVMGILDNGNLGAEFADNFKRMFQTRNGIPDGAQIEFINAARYLSEHQQWPLDDQSMVFIVSKSGDSQAIYALEDVIRRMEALGNEAYYVVSEDGKSPIAEMAPGDHVLDYMAKSPSQIPNLTSQACQFILNEVLLMWAKRSLELTSPGGKSPHGLLLTEEDVTALEERRDFFEQTEASETTAADLQGRKLLITDPGATHNTILGAAQDPRTKGRMLDSWRGFWITHGFLYLTIAILPHALPALLGVDFHFNLLPSWPILMLADAPGQGPPAGMNLVLHILADNANYAVYGIFGTAIVWFLRAFRGRYPWARQSTPPVRIAEGENAHQIVDLQVDRVFNKALGIVSVHTRSGDNISDFVNRYEPSGSSGIVIAGFPRKDLPGLNYRVPATTALNIYKTNAPTKRGKDVIVGFSHSADVDPSAVDILILLPKPPAVRGGSIHLGPLIENMYDKWGRVLGESVLVNRTGEELFTSRNRRVERFSQLRPFRRFRILFQWAFHLHTRWATWVAGREPNTRSPAPPIPAPVDAPAATAVDDPRFDEGVTQIHPLAQPKPAPEPEVQPEPRVEPRPEPLRAPSGAPAAAQWLEARLADDGKLSLRKLAVENGALWDAGPADLAKKDYNGRVEAFLAAASALQDEPAHILRIAMGAEPLDAGPTLFAGTPGDARLMTEKAFRRLAFGKLPVEDALAGSLWMEGRAMPPHEPARDELRARLQGRKRLGSNGSPTNGSRVSNGHRSLIRIPGTDSGRGPAEEPRTGNGHGRDPFEEHGYVTDMFLTEEGVEVRETSLDGSAVRNGDTGFISDDNLRKFLGRFPGTALRTVHGRPGKPLPENAGLPKTEGDRPFLILTPNFLELLRWAGSGRDVENIAARVKKAVALPEDERPFWLKAASPEVLSLLSLIPVGLFLVLAEGCETASSSVAGGPGLLAKLAPFLVIGAAWAGINHRLRAPRGEPQAPVRASTAEPAPEAWSPEEVARRTMRVYGDEFLKPLADGRAPGDPAGRTARGLGFLHENGDLLSDAGPAERVRLTADLARARLSRAAAGADRRWLSALPELGPLLGRFNPEFLSHEDLARARPLTLPRGRDENSTRDEMAALLADGALAGAAPAARTMGSYLWGRTVRDFLRKPASAGALLDLSKPVLSADPRSADVLALRMADPGHDGELAALVAVEALRRRETGAGAPRIMLIADDGIRLQNAYGRFGKALRAWRGEDGAMLTGAEVAAVLGNTLIDPLRDFLAAGEDGAFLPDGGLLHARAARDFNLRTGFTLFIADLDGTEWRVPKGMEKHILVIHLFLPGVGVLLTPALLDTWRAALIAA